VIVAFAVLELLVILSDSGANDVGFVKSNGVPFTARNSPVGIRPESTGVNRSA
jgi:hypothetical protein